MKQNTRHLFAGTIPAMRRRPQVKPAGTCYHTNINIRGFCSRRYKPEEKFWLQNLSCYVDLC